MAIQHNAEAGPSYIASATLSAHTRSVTALRFSTDGRTLVSAGADGYVHFWDAASGGHRRALRCHYTGINDMSLSADGLYLATASDDGTSLVWPMDPWTSVGRVHPPPADSDGDGEPQVEATPGPSSLRPTPLRTLEGHTAPVLAVAFGPRGNILVTGSYDESAIIWDVRRGRALRSIPAHADAVWSVGFDAEGALVITGSADGLIRLWDVSTGQCLKTLDNESNSPVSSASFTPSSFYILSTTLSSTIRIYSLYTGKVLKTLQASDYVSERYPSPAIVFGGPTRRRAQANGHGDPDAMDIDSDGDGEPHTGGDGNGAGEDADGRNGPARGGAAPRPAWVVAGSENGRVVLWDMQDRRVFQVLEGHSAPVIAVAVSPDGRMIASGSLEPEKSIRLWQI